MVGFFCFKQKTAYEMRISDWSSDVCSSDLAAMDMAMDIMLARHRRDSAAQRRFGLDQRFGSRRAHVDAQDRAVGHDIFRAAGVDLRRVTLQRGRLELGAPQREVGRGEYARASARYSVCKYW